MARPLLACLLVCACTTENPWFDVDATSAGTTATPPGTTDDPTTASPTTSTASTTSTSTGDDETTDALTVAVTTGPPDLPQGDTSTSTTDGATTDATTTADDTTGDPPIESDTDLIDLIPCELAVPSPIACFDFENTQPDAGKLIDTSSYTHDGTTIDPAFFPGVDGQAMKVNSMTKGSAAHAPHLSPSELTISAWVLLPNMTPDGAAIVEKYGQYSLSIGDDDTGLTCKMKGLELSTEQPFPKNTWTHVACVYTGDSMVLYLDGEAVLTLNDVDPDISKGQNQLTVGCGGGPSCQQRLINARIDRVRLWDSALEHEFICLEAGC